jgi:hypothetical protein
MSKMNAGSVARTGQDFADHSASRLGIYSDPLGVKIGHCTRKTREQCQNIDRDAQIESAARRILVRAVRN